MRAADKRGEIRETRTGAVVAGLAAAALMAALMASSASADEWVAPADAAAVANPTADNADTVAAGKQVYGNRCQGCHGQAGNGDGPDAADLGIHPAKFSGMSVHDESDGAWFWKIQTGKKPMPKYGAKLTPEQTWQVIRYVRTLEKDHG